VIYLKLKSFFLVSGILLSVVLVFVIMGSVRSSFPTDTASSGYRKIIIDPGHGGIDGGAVGIDGVIEKDINLAISLKLKSIFEMSGFEVIMTRESDESIHDKGLVGVLKQKKSDMRNRLKIINENPDAIVLSIHQNKFEVEKYHGAQMFYGAKNPLSYELAKALQEKFTLLQKDNKREIKKGTKDLFLLYKSENPIVLIECGFISNYEECANLVSEDYQSKVAFIIYSAVYEKLSDFKIKEKQYG